MLELCKARVQILHPSQATATSGKMTVNEAKEVFQRQGGMSVLVGYLYSNVTQQLKVP
jgi:hypothetical protein